MKARIALISGTAAGCMALAGCGGGSSHTVSNPVAPTPTTTMLDTVEVFDIVRTKTSETAQPFAVNGGAVAFTPVDDSTQATVVDGT
jgi:uncharacterized membrane protein